MLRSSIKDGVEAGLVLVHKLVRLMAEVFADKNPVSFERKSTSTADDGDSDALVG